MVGAVDEADLERNPERLDAAAAVVLTSTPSAWRVAGVGLAGAGQVSHAAARALASHRATRLDRHPEALAAGALLSLTRALHGSTSADSFLIVDDSEAASVAVLLTRSPA